MTYKVDDVSGCSSSSFLSAKIYPVPHEFLWPRWFPGGEGGVLGRKGGGRGRGGAREGGGRGRDTGITQYEGQVSEPC